MSRSFGEDSGHKKLRRGLTTASEFYVPALSESASPFATAETVAL